MHYLGTTVKDEVDNRRPSDLDRTHGDMRLLLGVPGHGMWTRFANGKFSGVEGGRLS